MRVRMKTIMCGPDISASPGQVIDVPDDRAQDLVAGGYAEPVLVPPGRETATAPRAPETATVPKRLDTTPGGISTVNSEEALELIAKAKTAEDLDKLEVAEKASQKHPDGRKGVLAAIAERREELGQKDKESK